MLRAGDTLLLGPEEDYHLHIILTDANDDGELILASVTTLQKWTKDRTVVLKKGDHPFIQHDSGIAYSFARIVSAAEIESVVSNKPSLVRQPMSPEVLNRVQAGLLESDFTENGVRWFYRDLNQAG